MVSTRTMVKMQLEDFPDVTPYYDWGSKPEINLIRGTRDPQATVQEK